MPFESLAFTKTTLFVNAAFRLNFKLLMSSFYMWMLCKNSSSKFIKLHHFYIRELKEWIQILFFFLQMSCHRSEITIRYTLWDRSPRAPILALAKHIHNYANKNKSTEGFRYKNCLRIIALMSSCLRGSDWVKMVKIIKFLFFFFCSKSVFMYGGITSQIFRGLAALEPPPQMGGKGGVRFFRFQ